MARRRKSSTADDLMDLVALLPWWAGVALAAVSYVVLHAVASRPIAAPVAGQPVGAMMSSMIWQGLATGGQFVLPLICLMGALASFVRRRRRAQLFDQATASDSAQLLKGMRWDEFELLVGEGFRRRGYAVRELGGKGADGGVDLELTKAGEISLVQCKHWKAFKVGVPIVRELYGVMAAQGAAGGFVVTSGRFTPEATAFASGRNIRLIDGPALNQLLRESRDARDVKAPREHVAPAPRVSADAATAHTASAPSAAPQTSFTPVAEPVCPRCGLPMVQRVAKRGTGSGQAFWGCSGYPGCKGTRPL